MSHRRAAIAAWGMCALTLAAAACAAGLAIGVAGTDWAAILPEAEPPQEGVLVALLDGAWVVAFTVVGAFLASHVPRNPVGWLLGVIPAALVFNFLGESFYWHAASADPQAPGALAEFGLWLANSSWVPAVIVVLVLLPLHFPTGRPPTAAVADRPLGGDRRRARPLRRGGLRARPAGELPVGGQPARARGDAGRRGRGRRPAWFGSTLAAAASIVVRFRRAHGAERAQIKWFTVAAAQLVVAFAVSFSLAPVIGEQTSWVIVAMALLALALAVAIGVMRYRLYDIDVVINRALVYGGLTATLGAAYLGTVLLVGLAIGRSGFAVAVSTLAVAALFGPARARIQALVDRRFYRHKYDAERTLEAFAARLRDEVALDALDSSSAAWCGRRCSQRTCRCGCEAAD